ncbi:unnamed protein product [Orchesella dallaii]|uniref:Uncharacterized protein n=1 Tax=Orchesella dallaii TaxID=48710 RepID=A0ABP1QNK3_9HEXA
MDDLLNTEYSSMWEDFVALLETEENPAATNFQILFPNSHRLLSSNANGFECLENLDQPWELPVPNFTTNQPPPASSETEMSSTEFSNPNAPVTTTTNNYNTTSSKNQLCIDNWKKRWESDYNLCSTEQETSSARTCAFTGGVDVYNRPIVRNEGKSPTLETMMAETESSKNLMAPKLAFTPGGCKRSQRMLVPPGENEKKLVLSPKLSSSMKSSKNLDQSSPSSSTASATSLQDKKKRMTYSQACDILNPLSNNCGNLSVPLSSGLLPLRIGAERRGLAMMGESQFRVSL